MEDKLLEKIESPQDIKNLSVKELENLSDEIRQEIVSVVSKNGGHLSPNLGVVELTVALHKVFDSPKDKIVFDVGHQCYAHKMLTGRYKQMDTLRKEGGLSGFPSHLEIQMMPLVQVIAVHQFRQPMDFNVPISLMMMTAMLLLLSVMVHCLEDLLSRD